MIIGITGLMGSGKDLTGELINEILSEYNESKFQIKKYAGKLKEICAILIGCNLSDFEDREFKEKELGEEWWYWKHEGGLIPYNDSTGTLDCELIKLTPRLIQQLLGTEAGRHIIHPNIWVNALFADFKQLVSPGYTDNWIITDVRFPNEAKAIKDRGGIMIRVNRSQFLIDGKVILKDEHASETGLDDYDKFDYVIDNDGTVQDLIDKVKSLNIVKRIL